MDAPENVIPVVTIESWQLAATVEPDRAVILTLCPYGGEPFEAFGFVLDHRDARAIANGLIEYADHVAVKLAEDEDGLGR